MAVRGSASIDTGHWGNRDKEIERKIAFPAILKSKVNMKKVVIAAIKPWIKQQIDTLLGFEDDVVVNLVYNLLETEQFPDAQSMSVKLMGFLENDTISFMTNLWTHLIDANNNKLGIPTKLLADAQRKQKIKKEQKEQKLGRYQLKKEIEHKHSTNSHKPKFVPKHRETHKVDVKQRTHRNQVHVHRDDNHTNHQRIKKEEISDGDMEWTPSPSPPAILRQSQSMAVRRNSSPLPPKQLEYNEHSEDKKHSRHRRRRHKSRKRRSSSRSYSRSRSRSRSYSRRRSRKH